RNLEAPLQATEAVEREPRAVLQEPDHAPGRGIILLAARLFRRRRGKHLAAEVAPQLLQHVDLCRQRRLPGDSHQHAWGLLIDSALTAGRTRLPSSERWVRNLDSHGPAVSVGAVAPVPLGSGRCVRLDGLAWSGLVGGDGGVGYGARLRNRVGILGIAPHHGFSLFGARPEE